MARIDKLSNFLTDIANSIRNKKGTIEPILASDFDTEIDTIITNEDLNKELTNYDNELIIQENYIVTIQEKLKSKAFAKQDNLFNIFLQEEEPSIKQGLWLKTDKTFESVVFRESHAGTEWKYTQTRKPIPYNFSSGTAERIGDFVYLFGGNNGMYNAYKYDLVNDTYTKLSSIPRKNAVSPSVAVGNDIYLFGYWDYYSIYKYDVTTDKYTQISFPTGHYSTGSGVVAIGDYIYMFGSDGGETKGIKASRYDIKNDTWTSLTNIPYATTQPQPAVVGTDVYLICSPNYSWAGGQSYKYDTINNTYTKISNPPDSFCCTSSYVDGTDIYVFGYKSGEDTVAYRYDTILDIYTKMANTEYVISGNFSSNIEYNGEILVFGGSKLGANVIGLSIEKSDSELYDTDTVIIDVKSNDIPNDYFFQLFNTNQIINKLATSNDYPFKDITYQSADGSIIKTIPTYYGDGTEWVKFKN